LKTDNSITSNATSRTTNRTNHPISAETPLVRFVVNLHTDATTMVVYKVKYGTNVQQVYSKRTTNRGSGVWILDRGY